MSLHNTTNTTKNMNADIDELSNVVQNASNTIVNPLAPSVSITGKRKACIDISDTAKKKPIIESIYIEKHQKQATETSTVMATYIAFTTSTWELPFELNKAYNYHIKWDILNVQWEENGEVVEYHPDEKDYEDCTHRSMRPDIVEINEVRVKEDFYTEEINRLKAEINILKTAATKSTK